SAKSVIIAFMVETVKIRSKSSAEKRKPNIFWLIASLVLPAWSCIVRYRFTKTSQLPQQGPFILAPNHYSEIDPLVIGAATWHMGRLPRFMAKASLFRIPVVKWLLNWSGQIPVERAGAEGASRGGSAMSAAEEVIRRQAGVVV